MNTKQIAKIYKIPIKYNVNPEKNCNWDGKYINAKGLSEQDIMHELCHNIVAKRKNIPEYGLGRGPNSTFDAYWNKLEKLNLKIKMDSSFIEEDRACILEFIFAAIYNDDYKNLMYGRQYIDINLDGICRLLLNKKEFMNHIRALKRKNIINKYWIPSKLKQTNKKLSLIKQFRSFIRSMK